MVPNIYFYLFNEPKTKMHGKNMLDMWACAPESLERSLTHRETFFIYIYIYKRGWVIFFLKKNIYDTLFIILDFSDQIVVEKSWQRFFYLKK
jgi:hypothetical protein